uniref:Uncharacterized protein n=1 Tax=Oryza sativa subsp. japonica TaxID=39947 RepID=Q6YY08_ORYSJ|nr:hypothetical protein [Oryza sativa Japonica Group]BAD17492.1 hypothetical protein [Oryza sativa Japonica Group]
MATVWMCWAAKAVDRTAEFSSRERGLARSRSESWQPCSELAAMRRQSMIVAEVEDLDVSAQGWGRRGNRAWAASGLTWRRPGGMARARGAAGVAEN